jgi:mono/diheme cytochrome c family protein
MLRLLTCSIVHAADRIRIEPSPQRTGDPRKGYDYLVQGDYISSGVPLELFKATHNATSPDVLNRPGDNATIPFNFTAHAAPNGVKIVAPNCLSCHAETLRGQFILGLGNTTGDFTLGAGARIANTIDQMIIATFGETSPQREAFARFRDVSLVIGPQVRAKIRGTNPADKLAYVLAAHRDPQTLTWSDKPLVPLPPADEIVPTDVPPLWLLKKKHAMFYTGIGRGDFSRIMMASSLLTITGVEEAARIDARFADVLAYIQTLEPPKYPGSPSFKLVRRGREVFNQNCAECHGRYDDKPGYPNLLIRIEEVGTDPLLAESTHTTYAPARQAYNRSWFGTGEHAAQLISQRGYIAPPLDGIWATAPYLHNGSVPDLTSLLNSRLRPKRWLRTFNSDDYDLETVGWKYVTPAADAKTPKKLIYDTTVPGYGNGGHTYADDLSDNDRRALLEYIKTL